MSTNKSQSFNAPDLPPLRDVEKETILMRLEAFDGNRTHAAKSLGIGIRTLQRKLQSYGMRFYLLSDKQKEAYVKMVDSIQSKRGAVK